MPLVHPGSETYDIVFTAPRFTRAGTLEKPAVVTVTTASSCTRHVFLGTDGAQEDRSVYEYGKRAAWPCRITATPFAITATSGLER